MAFFNPVSPISFRLHLCTPQYLPDLLDYNLTNQSLLPELKEAINFPQFDCIKGILAKLVEELTTYHHAEGLTQRSICYQRSCDLVIDIREQNRLMPPSTDGLTDLKKPKKPKVFESFPTEKIARQWVDEDTDEKSRVKRTKFDIPKRSDEADIDDEVEVILERFAPPPTHTLNAAFLPPLPLHTRFSRQTTGAASPTRQLFINTEEETKQQIEMANRDGVLKPPVPPSTPSIPKPEPSSITVTEDGRIRWKAAAHASPSPLSGKFNRRNRVIDLPSLFDEPPLYMRAHLTKAHDLSHGSESTHPPLELAPDGKPPLPEPKSNHPPVVNFRNISGSFAPFSLAPMAPPPTVLASPAAPPPAAPKPTFAVPAPKPSRTGIAPLGSAPTGPSGTKQPPSLSAAFAFSRLDELTEDEQSFDEDIELIYLYVIRGNWRGACNYLLTEFEEDVPFPATIKVTKADFLEILAELPAVKDGLFKKYPTLLIEDRDKTPHVSVPPIPKPAAVVAAPLKESLDPYRMQIEMIATYLSVNEWKSAATLLWTLLRKTGPCDVTTKEGMRGLLKENEVALNAVVCELMNQGVNCTFWF